MLIELRVRDLGVIDDMQLHLGQGLTAITGETGAGKTLVVEAIDLLVGGRGDPTRVRAGADEASIEGRFAGDDDDVVLARAVQAAGRSRAYVDGRMAPVGQLTEVGGALVDLHGQHAHQSLLAPAVQRDALDRFGSIDLTPRRAARDEVRAADEALAALGGDARTRAQEVDLLRYQVDELTAAQLTDADEDERLAAEEELLADASALREAAAAACEALSGEDGGAGDNVGRAIAELASRPTFASAADRLRAAAGELADVAADLRTVGDRLHDDPERLAEIQARRQVLTGLRRKYGDTLADVIAFAATAGERLAELGSYEERAAALETERSAARARLRDAEAAISAARQKAAPKLATAVTKQLPDLALQGATFDVEIGDDPAGDDVRFLFTANAGEPVRLLAKVASGGELARCMLALRLVLRDRTIPTLVFDEVDAGIGGQAAVAVGQALASLANDHQVLVVTHLPQVAAFADHHVAVVKAAKGRAVATVEVLDDAGRVAELTRMLSGLPESETGRDHANELLETARQAKGSRR